MVSSLFLDGPVTVGMSLDIASIDTISEINMVRHTYDRSVPLGQCVYWTQVNLCWIHLSASASLS